MMKKLSILAIAVILIMSALAGCGGNNGGNTAKEPSKGPDNKVEEPNTAAAPEYPTENINIIVPWVPGGGQDLLARAVQSALSEKGYTVVVTNVEGSSGGIGAMEVFHADPDGYTILCNNNEAMYSYYLGGVNQASPKDFTQLGTMVYDGNAICVAPNSQFKSLTDLVEYAKANPGELQWGASGTNGFNHISSAMVWDAAGIEVNYVPYDGGAKVRTAGMGGQVDAILCQTSEVKAAVESGDLICLATTTSERVAFMPDVPTCSEQGYDIVVGINRGFFGPGGMDEELTAAVGKVLKEAYDSEGFTQMLIDNMGFNPDYKSPEEAQELLNTVSVDIENWYKSLVEG